MTGKNLADLALEVIPERWGYIYGQAGAVWTEEKQKRLEQTTEKKY